MRTFLIVTLAAVIASGPSSGCDIIYPADYVPPTIEDRIAGAHTAFIGTVTGLRRNDGEIVTYAAPQCAASDPDADCWDGYWDRYDDYYTPLVTGILAVEEPIHGVERGSSFEIRRGEGGGACDYELELGERYLVLDHDADWLSTEEVGVDQLAAWRAIDVVN